MIKEGYVFEFDNYNGIIKDDDGKDYIFNVENVKGKISVNDRVTFVPEVFETVEIKKDIAVFIEKINN